MPMCIRWMMQRDCMGVTTSWHLKRARPRMQYPEAVVEKQRGLANGPLHVGQQSGKGQFCLLITSCAPCRKAIGGLPEHISSTETTTGIRQ